MKSSLKILFVFGIIFALMVGLFVGLSMKIGDVNQNDYAGTMAKINNYKKAQSSVTGSEIENQLLSDTVRLKNMQNYLRYYYTTSVKMAGDIRFSIDQANASEAFKNKYSQEITELGSYEKSFDLARIDLLIALRACLNPEKCDPLLLSEFVNQASNVIAQLNFRNSVVLDFIDILDSYLKENKTLNLEGLTNAHDLLMYNELNSGIMTRNKLVINSFNNKVFLSGVKNQKLVDPTSLKDLMKKDLEKLALLDAEVPYLKDSEKIGVDDIRKLGLDDIGKLGFIDSDKLGNFDSEKPINFNKGVEKLGRPFWNY